MAEQLKTIEDAMEAGDPNMIVDHDGEHDYQTCATCGRSWGSSASDYPMPIDPDDPGTVCPDPECGGVMGMYAMAHMAWEDPD